MKTESKTVNQRVVLIAIACVLMGMAALAFAVPPNEVVRVETNQTFTGVCCFTWGETVTLTEPRALVPVVVIWSTDYQTSGNFVAGISVNGHPCMSMHPLDQLFNTDGTFDDRSLQWVIFPADGLIKGNNTFTLCGGGFAGSITLGFNTLAVRIAR